MGMSLSFHFQGIPLQFLSQDVSLKFLSQDLPLIFFQEENWSILSFYHTFANSREGECLYTSQTIAIFLWLIGGHNILNFAEIHWLTLYNY